MKMEYKDVNGNLIKILGNPDIKKAYKKSKIHEGYDEYEEELHIFYLISVFENCEKIEEVSIPKLDEIDSELHSGMFGELEKLSQAGADSSQVLGLINNFQPYSEKLVDAEEMLGFEDSDEDDFPYYDLTNGFQYYSFKETYNPIFNKLKGGDE
jgi:hypothetical protein